MAIYARTLRWHIFLNTLYAFYTFITYTRFSSEAETSKTSETEESHDRSRVKPSQSGEVSVKPRALGSEPATIDALVRAVTN